jgi:hypothetical protein
VGVASIRDASRDAIHAAATAGLPIFLGISAYQHLDERHPEQHLQSRDHLRGLNHLSTRDCAQCAKRASGTNPDTTARAAPR